MESNSEWVDDIDSILRKNRERDIIRSAVVIVLLLTTFVLMGYLQKSYWFGVIGLTVFFSIFIITNYLPKRIKLSFSQTLAFQLFKVYNNIAKYDGKNEYFKDECFKNLKKINENIDSYLNTKSEEYFMDFDSERISSNLEKLEDQNRKIYSFFNDYEKYKDRQENLKMFYLNFANLFHYRENFPAEIATYMKELEEIDLPFWIHEPKSKPILKRLLVESKLWILILYSSAVILSIWIGLDYVYPDYSVQNKITVTAMLIGGAIIQFIFKRPKSVVQSEKSSDK